MKNCVKSVPWNEKSDWHMRHSGFCGELRRRFLKNALQDSEKTKEKEGAIE